MANKKEQRYCAGERSILKDILPLDYPLSLTVEASSACNFRCNYCSIALAYKDSTTDFRKKVLSYEEFLKVVNDIKAGGYHLRALNLARIGEPLLNRRLPEMIAYAKLSGVFERIVLITNGSLLNPALNQKLIDAGLDRMLISIQGLSAQNYLEVSRFKINFEAFIENIRHFYCNRKQCQLHIKAFHEALDGDEERFYKLFENICDTLSIEHVVPYMNDVDYESIKCEHEKNRYGESIQNVLICPLPFYTLSVLSDGHVAACCINNHDSFIVGHIRDNSIEEIWHSRKLKNFRKMHILGNRSKHSECGRCTFPVYGIQDSDNLEGISEPLRAHYLR